MRLKYRRRRTSNPWAETEVSSVVQLTRNDFLTFEFDFNGEILSPDNANTYEEVLEEYNKLKTWSLLNEC